MLSHDRQASRLRELVSAEDSDQSDSSAGTCSNQAVELESSEPLSTNTVGNKRKRKGKGTLPHWTKREISNRESLNIGWKNTINNDCHREYLLKFLQEEKCDLEMPKAAPEDCCNGSRCNPFLLKDEVATAVSTAPDIVRKPTAGSRGGIAQRRLIEWCRDRADELIGSDELLTRMPSAYFLPCRFQWAIAHVFNDRRWKTAADFPIRRSRVSLRLHSSSRRVNTVASTWKVPRFPLFTYFILPYMSKSWMKACVKIYLSSKV